MRIRSIKPEFYRSDDIDRLDWHARLLFIGLWSYVDDNGVGRDREADIAADLFSGDLSRDARETLARVADGLQQLSEGGQIVRYSADGKHYLYITAWEKHQKIDRPAKPRYPLPTGADRPETGASSDDSRDLRESASEDSRQSRESASTGTGEQGNRGIKRTPSSAVKPPKREIPKNLESAFDEFWSVYPRRKGKLESERKFTIAARRADPSVIIAGARRYAAVNRQTEERFIAHPATWLHQGRWEDDTRPKPEQRVGLVREW